MTLTTYPQLEQGTPEWLAARLGLVTASAVGQLITAKTIKPASNDFSRGLTGQLVAERISGYSEPVYVNADMERGNDNEPRARDKYSEHYAPVTEMGFMVKEFDNGSKLGYSPDGLVGDDGLIEIKSPRSKKHVAIILGGYVPLQYMAQLQAGLLVTGRDWIDFISYSGGLPMFVKRVHPDVRWFDAIAEAVHVFEQTADSMVSDFHELTKGLVPTERALDLEEIRF